MASLFMRSSRFLLRNGTPQSPPQRKKMTMLVFIVCLCLLQASLPSAVAQTTPSPAPTTREEGCKSSCRPISCIDVWWRRDARPLPLIGAAILVFFATFLPRVLVRLVIFVLTKVPFIVQTAEDFREHCSGSSAYLMSASLVMIALSVSKLVDFFCHLHNYIWGIFFIVWLYSLFNVVESLAVRRFVGANGDLSKRVVISESVKILRLTTLLIIALIIYSSAVGNQAMLKYSVLAVIGLAIALGFVPSFHNVVGGLFLAFNSQFKIDDFIEVSDSKGFVHRVSLRYTTIVTTEGTQSFVPNSFFLYKPMVNYSQRPKRDIDIRVRVSPDTPVETLRQCLTKLEIMLQSLHMGLTSHEENQSDLRHGEKWERFFFVAMEKLFEIRLYSYTDELDERKYAMIRSEVWLALMEILEELGIQVVRDPYASCGIGNDTDNDATGFLTKRATVTFTAGGLPGVDSPTRGNGRGERDRPMLESPFASEMNSVIGARGSRTPL